MSADSFLELFLISVGEKKDSVTVTSRLIFQKPMELWVVWTTMVDIKILVYDFGRILRSGLEDQVSLIGITLSLSQRVAYNYIGIML